MVCEPKPVLPFFRFFVLKCRLQVQSYPVLRVLKYPQFAVNRGLQLTRFEQVSAKLGTKSLISRGAGYTASSLSSPSDLLREEQKEGPSGAAPSVTRVSLDGRSSELRDCSKSRNGMYWGETLSEETSGEAAKKFSHARATSPHIRGACPQAKMTEKGNRALLGYSALDTKGIH